MNNGVLQFGAEGFRECAEQLELVAIARDELASPLLDLGQSAKAVILDLEQPVLMGEWFRAPFQLERLEFHYIPYSVPGAVSSPLPNNAPQQRQRIKTP